MAEVTSLRYLSLLLTGFIMLRRASALISRSPAIHTRSATTIASSSVIPASPPKPPSSRGRSKPRSTSLSGQSRLSRTSISSLASTPHESTSNTDDGQRSTEVRRTQGRHRPFSSRRKPESKMINQFPTSKEYSFQPVHLYPVPLHLHLSFTPPHQPIMANLGHRQYLEPTTSSSTSSVSSQMSNLFNATPPTNTASTPKFYPSSSSLGDHMSVVRSLSQPSLVHNLLEPTALPSPTEDPEGNLFRRLSETAVKFDLSNELDFEKTLRTLGDPSAKASDSVNADGSEGSKEMDSALAGLKGLMSKLKLGDSRVNLIKGDESGTEAAGSRGRRKIMEAGSIKIMTLEQLEDEEVSGMRIIDRFEGLSQAEEISLDSVKRKRKKKITKHKYKKRRKVSHPRRRNI